MKKIIICGCQGKMGHVLESCIAERDDCEVVAGFDIATEPKKPYPVFSHFADCTVDADVIIVQDRGETDVYEDSLGNFAKDSGTEVPSYIQSMDRCWDSGLAVLNGGAFTEDAEAWASALVERAGELFAAQYARLNPEPEPEPEPTEEEKAAMALQEKISEAQNYLYSTDYRILKFMDKQIESNAELKAAFEAEYPDTLEKRQEVHLQTFCSAT